MGSIYVFVNFDYNQNMAKIEKVVEIERYRLWVTLSPEFGELFAEWAERAGLKPQDMAVMVLKMHAQEVAEKLGVVEKGEKLPSAVNPNRTNT